MKKKKRTVKVSCFKSIRNDPIKVYHKKLPTALIRKNRRKKREQKNMRRKMSKMITKISPRVKATSLWLSITFAVDRHLRTPVKLMFRKASPPPQPRQERAAVPLPTNSTVTKRS